MNTYVVRAVVDIIVEARSEGEAMKKAERGKGKIDYSHCKDVFLYENKED